MLFPSSHSRLRTDHIDGQDEKDKPADRLSGDVSMPKMKIIVMHLASRMCAVGGLNWRSGSERGVHSGIVWANPCGDPSGATTRSGTGTQFEKLARIALR